MVLILATKRVLDLGRNTTLLLTVATRENIWCNWLRWDLPYIQAFARMKRAWAGQDSPMCRDCFRRQGPHHRLNVCNFLIR